MQVHDAAALELRHPAEGQPDALLRLPLGPPESAGQVAQHVDGGPPPQLGRTGVLQHGALEVVAVLAEWSANHGVAVIVMLRTRQLAAVHSTWPTGTGMARPAVSGRVDGTEAGGGQGQQDGGPLGHGLVDPLAADQPGPDEVAGIPSVDGGTRRAAALPPGPAGLEEHAVGETAGREDPYPIVARPGDDCAPQANGMAAPAAALALGREVVELPGSEPATHGPEHLPIVGVQVGWFHAGQGGSPV